MNRGQHNMNRGQYSMNRGQTWAKEEIQCLIDIWSDEHISAQLSRTRKNADIFALFSKQMRERGFQRSVEQCRIKAKKLRQQYVKVRDALNKTGSSCKMKEKFEWYDAMDKILARKPVDMVESYEEKTKDIYTQTEANVSTALQAEEEDTSSDSDSTSTQENELIQTSGRLQIPGAKSRKRKAKTSRRDDYFRIYMAQSNKILKGMMEAESRQMERDRVLLEMITSQQEANERRFSALMTHLQAQQQASNQLIQRCFSQLININSPAPA